MSKEYQALTSYEKMDLLWNMGKLYNIKHLPDGREIREIKKPTKEVYSISHLVAHLVIIPLLLLCLLQMPYGFYQFVRVVSCVGFGWLVHYENERKRYHLVAPYFLLCILFNPLIPINFERSSWAIIDVAVGITVLLLATIEMVIVSKRRKKLDSFFYHFGEILEKTSRGASYPHSYFIPEVRANKKLSKSEKEYLIGYLEGKISKLSDEERMVDLFMAWNLR